MKCDPAGFPMIWCEEVGAYVHWLPVTKIQFEYFLCDVPDAYFDGAWYERLLGLNTRISPGRVTPSNYWHTLMTGLQPSEAHRFAAWCGDEYRLPSAEQWATVYNSFAAQPSVRLTAREWNGLTPRVRELLERIDVASTEVANRMRQGPSRASQMLLRHGALEWVRVESPVWSWGLKGEPLPEFCGNLGAPFDSALAVEEAESSRFFAAGFRLLRVPSAEPLDNSEAAQQEITNHTSTGE